MRISLDSLSERALLGIIESFVLREGTEYGPSDHVLIDKCDEVLEQLRRGEALIDFDPTTDTIDIRRVLEDQKGMQDDKN